MVNLFENLMVLVTTERRKDTLLETVPNEVIIHNEIVIKEKEKDLLVVLRKKMRKIILMRKLYIHLMMKIDVDG